MQNFNNGFGRGFGMGYPNASSFGNDNGSSYGRNNFGGGMNVNMMGNRMPMQQNNMSMNHNMPMNHHSMMGGNMMGNRMPMQQNNMPMNHNMPMQHPSMMGGGNDFSNSFDLPMSGSPVDVNSMFGFGGSGGRPRNRSFVRQRGY